MNTKTTHHIKAADLSSFRRSVLRSGGVIVLSSPIGGDRYAVTVRQGSQPAARVIATPRVPKPRTEEDALRELSAVERILIHAAAASR